MRTFEIIKVRTGIQATLISLLMLQVSISEAQLRRRATSHDPAKSASSNNHASWSPDGKKIAFDSNRDGNNEIYIMNIDGSDQVRLTRHKSNDLVPTWSENGAMIYFQSKREEGFGIYEMPADGSAKPVLRKEGRPPKMSPDGEKQVLVSRRTGAMQIYVRNTGDTTLTQLTQEHFNTNPAWSPDGQHIVYSSIRPRGQGGIFIMNADGSNPVRISDGGSPSWSPDGTRLVFESYRSGYNTEIATMLIDGTDRKRLTYQFGILNKEELSQRGLPQTQREFIKVLREQGLNKAIEVLYEFKTLDSKYFVFGERGIESAAKVLFDNGDFQQALDFYKLNTMTFSHSSNAFYHLAKVYLALTDNEKALASVKEALRLNSKNEKARALMTRIEDNEP